MNPDISRWNAKYSAAAAGDYAQPDPLLVEHRALLTRGARVLDVACGAGANALVAARAGCRVAGVDASLAGLRIAARRARREGLALDLLNADLERWRPPPARFDLVMVFRYLHRGLFPDLASTLRPGGVLMYKTFNRNFLRRKPDMNPDYLLEPGELLKSFPGLGVVATNDGKGNQEDFSWWIGRAPSRGSRASAPRSFTPPR